MDVVLGVALTVDSVRLVLVDEDCSEGTVLDQDAFDVDRRGGVESASVTEHVVNAVLGTYGVAAATGHTVGRIAVTWTDDMAMEAELLVDALGEVGMPDVVAVTGCDAVEAYAERTAAANSQKCAAICLIEGVRSPIAYIAVLHTTADGTRRVRSRVVEAGDHRQLALSVRGASAECAADADRIAVFAAGSATAVTGMLAGELNSTLAAPVTIPENAALAFARGAALTAVGAHRRLHIVTPRVEQLALAVGDGITRGGSTRPPAPSVFVPRTAKLMVIPGVTTTATTTEPNPAETRRVRALSAVVGGGVLAFVAALSMFVGSQLRDSGEEKTTEAKSSPAEVAPAAAVEAPPEAAPAPAEPALPPPPPPAAPAVLAPPVAAPPVIIPAAVTAIPPAAAPAIPPNPLQLLAAVAGPQLAAINQGIQGGMQGNIPPIANPALNNTALQVAQTVVPPAIDKANEPLNVPAVPPITDHPVTLPPLRDMLDSVRPDRQNEDAHFGPNVPQPATPYYQPPGMAPAAAPLDAPAPPPDAPAPDAGAPPPLLPAEAP